MGRQATYESQFTLGSSHSPIWFGFLKTDDTILVDRLEYFRPSQLLIAEKFVD